MKKTALRLALIVVFVAFVTVCSRDRTQARAGASLSSVAVASGFGDTIKSIHTVKEYGKSLDWSHTRNLVAFGKLGGDGYYDVFVMKPDGSEERCVTCTDETLPQKHNGNPSWHPSGDYIAFTAEKGRVPRWLDRWAIPGTGINCDLWVATSDGSQFTRLTNLPLRLGRNQKGTIHPQFSHDGSKLLWSERVGAGRGSWGEWVLKTADFVVDRGTPRLKNTRTLQPGKQASFYESHGFSPDGRKVLFSGNLEAEHPENGLDIYSLDLRSEELSRLTKTPHDWDEQAHYSPSGQAIVWMSSRGLDIEWGDISGHNWKRQLKTELWIMRADGTGPTRLTNFNEPGWYGEDLGSQVIVSDNAWGPEGKAILATVAYGSVRKSRIVRIELVKAR